MIRSSLILACAIASFSFLAPITTFAHATPTTYTPEAGASVVAPPERIVINFSERIEREASSIKVFAPSGEEVHDGTAILDAVDPRNFSVALTSGGEGVYTVSWQVVSVDDGHFTKGSFSFLVSSAGEAFVGNAEAVQVTYVTRMSEGLYHAGALIGESLFLGILFFYLFVFRAYAHTRGDMRELTNIAETFLKSLVYLTTFAGIIFAASTIAVMVQKTSELASLRGESFAEGFLVYLSSSGGAALLAKLLLGLAFAGGFILVRKLTAGRPRAALAGDIGLVALLAILIVLQSKVSHAAASFFYPNVSVLVTVFHLFFKELLIGAGLVFAVFIGSLLKQGQVFGLSRITALFDRMAAVAMLFGGTTGAYITWLHLKRFESLWTTEWGERFLMLLAFGMLLFGCRMLNQFFFGPRASGSPTRLHAFRVVLALEIAFGVVVLFFSAYISITTPPFVVEQFSYRQERVTGNNVLTLEQHPYEAGMLRVRATAKDTQEPVSLDGLTVVLGNNEKGISDNVILAARRSADSFVFPKTSFTPRGAWSVHLVGKQIGAYDLEGSFSLNYPDDILATRHSDEVRVWNGFGRATVAVGALILLVSLVLILQAAWRLRRVPADDDTPKVLITAFPVTIAAIVFSCIVVLVALAVLSRVFTTPLESKCLLGGFEWKQALPAREMEVVAPNSVNGCFMHGGHYHLADEREYDFVLPGLTQPLSSATPHTTGVHIMENGNVMSDGGPLVDVIVLPDGTVQLGDGSVIVPVADYRKK